ncbi:hypothetical protein [Caulobacter sp. NIBR1757]|uniref:hypothetical protein n=1 Tax=Caulobacter sp. NIBR1757 TaxID=3016000 RepID=UPI0022F09F70|nr:hypothetical protein [Caulobacter sp. NIBR1757]WGM39278.1 hypothetical protein AMEJIAPC_02195 [Caulobacter sp. NIBR1757]
MSPSAKSQRIWFLIGLVLMTYCVLGNWLVLPGYRRHLAHVGGGEAVPALTLIWGAARTIVWMLSFHLGALCLAWAALVAGDGPRTFRRWFLAGAVVWIGLWAIPALPGPYRAFFAVTGVLIMGLILIAFGRAALTGQAFADGRGPHWRIAAAFFFALATWDICGLGSVGGILDPDGVARAASQTLVVTQTTKLIVELALAWALTAIAALPARKPA